MKKINKKSLSKIVFGAAITTLFAGFAPASMAVTDSALDVRAIYLAKSATATQITVTDPAKVGTWVDLPGSSVAVSRPSNTHELYLARFSAESICSGTVAGWCQVRILAGSTELSPTPGTDFAFDSTWNGTRPAGSWQSHAMERSASFEGPCSGTATTTFKVQYKVSAAGLSFRLDDWHFTVEAVSKGDIFTC